MITDAQSPWKVDSETGRLRDILLCRPEHYAWQPTNAVALKTLAEGSRGFSLDGVKQQYEGMVTALQENGVTCHFIEPLAHLPYQVYTRDSSQTTPWGPVVTQLFRPQRRGEYASIIRFYQETGGPWAYSTQGTLEGGDIHIIRPGLALIGHTGERTDEAGAKQFAGWFEERGWEVRLQPFAEHFLHLDLLFCMAADNLAVACLEVLDDDLVDWLRAHQIRLVPVSYKDAMQLACNLLALGDGKVIAAAHATAMNAALKAEGLEVIELPLDMLTRGGGGAHCMTMPLRRDPL
ncbi:dimethylarginine dimethylaminohydrolase family protein [Limibacillus halophilus]